MAANTFILLLRTLATSAHASLNITIILLEADIVNMLYQILTGGPKSKNKAMRWMDKVSAADLPT